MIPHDIAAISFPTRLAPARLSVAHFVLRHATSADVPFLLDLYRSFRADELAAIPWPDEQKHAFLDQQFAFQHRHYMATFPEADFLVVELESWPVGRLYLDFTRDNWLIIDIGLLPEWRGCGRGSAILSAILRQAGQSRAVSVTLHVEQHNVRARALYQRLGFRVEADGGSHIRMGWPCDDVRC